MSFRAPRFPRRPPPPSAAGGALPADASQRLHQKLSAFYLRVNPDRVGHVPAIVQMFEGESCARRAAMLRVRGECPTRRRGRTHLADARVHAQMKVLLPRHSVS